MVRIKRGLSQDQAQDLPVARTLEAKPVKKALFAPSNLPQHQTRFQSPLKAVKSLTGPPPTVSMVGYTAVRHSSVPVVVRAFPACVNIERNFFSTASQLSTCTSQQLLPDKRGAANRQTVPKTNLDKDPCVEVWKFLFWL